MHRFYRLGLSLCFFFFVVGVFLFGTTSLSDGTVKRQKEALEQAITHSIAYCYSVEGVYPESLDYLKEEYGLTYNEDLFFVDYRMTGANLMPDITIIERED